MAEYVYNQARYRRPILLSIFAILMVLSGLLVAIASVFIMIGGSVTLPDGVADIGFVAVGAVALIIGLINIFVGLALFSGKRWAWWLAVMIVALNIFIGLISIQVVAVLFYLVILLYLLMKNTKGWFDV